MALRVAPVVVGHRCDEGDKNISQYLLTAVRFFVFRVSVSGIIKSTMIARVQRISKGSMS